MHIIRQVTSDICWIGASDHRLSLFENIYPVPQGISYNAYLLKDEKTVLFDTVDAAVRQQFLENLKYALDERPLDYIVIHHMEPDHCAEIADLVRLYPEIKIVCNGQMQKMIEQFFSLNLPADKFIFVKEGDTLNTGRHTLHFIAAPMVHWPEVMMTYDTADKILFSADAFGTFGALNGNIFADEVDFEHFYLDEARRYYANIVGKYGPQVQNVLNKAAALDIRMICPLHGFIWRQNIEFYLQKYRQWSAYEPETEGVVIAYGSIYGNTYNTVALLAAELADAGVKNIRMYDVSVTHPSYIISDMFQYSTLVFAAPTYNGGIFVNMENLLRDLTAHNLQNRRIAVLDNGTWAAVAGKQMKEELAKLKNCVILESSLSLKSALKADQLPQIDALVKDIIAA
ncbi:MAG: MBL fold metallo-hydrolase [Alphaproteobacteria bacterium]|nr:MBL fold metallo-hydrolase [Alphaproteobacteria bacterium]